MKDVRIGMIGCGNIARAHLTALKDGKGIVCAGICDRIAEHAQKLNEEAGGGLRIFKDAREMVESQDVDAVILAVPNYQHEPMFRLAAENGKHILCEKPLTMSAELGEGMVEIARKYGIKTQMGLCSRFESDIEAMMDHIRAGNVGEIYFANTSMIRKRGTPAGWFCNKEKSGGGPLIDIAVHVIDACWYLMGKPKPIRCKALNYAKIPNRFPKDAELYEAYEKDPAFNVEDSTHGMITFENGAGLMYQASWSLNAETSDSMELFGTRGGLNRSKCTLIREEASGMTETNFHYLYADCYTRQLEAFGRVVRGEEESRTPVEDGLTIQRILNGLYRSAELGKEVEI